MTDPQPLSGKVYDHLPHAGEVWMFEGVGAVTLESLAHERREREVWMGWTNTKPGSYAELQRIHVQIPVKPESVCRRATDYEVRAFLGSL